MEKLYVSTQRSFGLTQSSIKQEKKKRGNAEEGNLNLLTLAKSLENSNWQEPAPF